MVEQWSANKTTQNWDHSVAQTIHFGVWNNKLVVVRVVLLTDLQPTQWTDTEPIVDRYRVHSGPIQSPQWTDTGPTVDRYRANSGPIQGPQWTHAEPTVDPCRAHSGPMHSPQWTDTGPTVDWYRAHSGLIQGPKVVFISNCPEYHRVHHNRL